METASIYRLAADLLLILHALFVAFVAMGFVAVLAGGIMAWSWVKNPWFRLVHMGATGVVAAQAWLGATCPLTTWESALRAKAGGSLYSGAFVAYWLDRLLYYDAPARVFMVGYTLFGAMVVAAWCLVPPRPFSSKTDHGGT